LNYYTLLSKRKLLQLVQEKRVHGWDDPRCNALRHSRRGFTPERFATSAMHASFTHNGSTDIADAGHFSAGDLKQKASRAFMAVAASA